MRVWRVAATSSPHAGEICLAFPITIEHALKSWNNSIGADRSVKLITWIIQIPLRQGTLFTQEVRSFC